MNASMQNRHMIACVVYFSLSFQSFCMLIFCISFISLTHEQNGWSNCAYCCITKCIMLVCIVVVHSIEQNTKRIRKIRTIPFFSFWCKTEFCVSNSRLSPLRPNPDYGTSDRNLSNSQVGFGRFFWVQVSPVRTRDSDWRTFNQL